MIVLGVLGVFPFLYAPPSFLFLDSVKLSPLEIGTQMQKTFWKKKTVFAGCVCLEHVHV